MFKNNQLIFKKTELEFKIMQLVYNIIQLIYKKSQLLFEIFKVELKTKMKQREFISSVKIDAAVPWLEK